MSRLHRNFLFLISVICLLSASALCLAQTAQQREEIRAFLQGWKQTNLITDADFDKLKAKYGKHLLPLLGEMLPDKELGTLALFSVDKIDSVGATPWKLKNLVNESGDRQFHTFRSANLALTDYELYVRRGMPAEDLTKPGPRYPPNTRPYPYKKELHDAAVAVTQKVLNSQGDADPVGPPLTIGLTGTRRDIPLLRRLQTRFPDNKMILAALAHLGDAGAIQAIESGLQEPAVTKPEEDIPHDNGRVTPARPGVQVTEAASGHRLYEWMEAAAYTLDKRFVPLLLAHIHDPRGQSHGDYSDRSPPDDASEALGKIVYGDPGIGWTKKPADWDVWAASHPKEASGR